MSGSSETGQVGGFESRGAPDSLSPSTRDLAADEIDREAAAEWWEGDGVAQAGPDESLASCVTTEVGTGREHDAEAQATQAEIEAVRQSLTESIARVEASLEELTEVNGLGADIVPLLDAVRSDLGPGAGRIEERLETLSAKLDTLAGSGTSPADPSTLQRELRDSFEDLRDRLGAIKKSVDAVHAEFLARAASSEDLTGVLRWSLERTVAGLDILQRDAARTSDLHELRAHLRNSPVAAQVTYAVAPGAGVGRAGDGSRLAMTAGLALTAVSWIPLLVLPVEPARVVVLLAINLLGVTSALTGLFRMIRG